ncbi:MAG TPA: hypothetical protein VGQ21_03250 [Thermoanaerobaculia bacterium]|nr:hypothetical protein [Thermoanaerobaculia bacterium]
MDDPSLGFEHLTFPAYLEVAAGMAAVAAARYLISGKSFLVGRSLRFDFDRLAASTPRRFSGYRDVPRDRRADRSECGP